MPDGFIRGLPGCPPIQSWDAKHPYDIVEDVRDTGRPPEHALAVPAYPVVVLIAGQWSGVCVWHTCRSALRRSVPVRPRAAVGVRAGRPAPRRGRRGPRLRFPSGRTGAANVISLYGNLGQPSHIRPPTGDLSPREPDRRQWEGCHEWAGRMHRIGQPAEPHGYPEKEGGIGIGDGQRHRAGHPDRVCRHRIGSGHRRGRRRGRGCRHRRARHRALAVSGGVEYPATTARPVDLADRPAPTSSSGDRNGGCDDQWVTQRR